MEYTSELDLADAGFVLTPNIWHTGKGSGKVFEKIVDDMRVFYGVDVDGSVVKLEFTGGQPTPVAPVAPEAQVEPVAEVAPASTDVAPDSVPATDETSEVTETAPEAQE